MATDDIHRDMDPKRTNPIAALICPEKRPEFPYAACHRQVEAISHPEREYLLLRLHQLCGGYYRLQGKEYDKNSPEVAGCVTGHLRNPAIRFAEPELFWSCPDGEQVYSLEDATACRSKRTVVVIGRSYAQTRPATTPPPPTPSPPPVATPRTPVTPPPTEVTYSADACLPLGALFDRLEIQQADGGTSTHTTLPEIYFDVAGRRVFFSEHSFEYHLDCAGDICELESSIGATDAGPNTDSVRFNKKQVDMLGVCLVDGALKVGLIK